MKFLMCMILCTCLTACGYNKPPLDETQVVDGKSIIIPPEFNQLPKEN